MILRRLANSIRKQDWFAVVIETLIVVMGVFIGLQVNNWNEARKDREDEAMFLARLHPEIMRVEESSARMRERRIELIEHLREAANVIFHGAPDDRLTVEQCYSFASSHYYNINILGLPSLDELTNSGRVGIIGDEAMRNALVTYQQRVVAFNQYVDRESALINNLLVITPDLLKVGPMFDTKLGEMQTEAVCDVPGMRDNQLFRNAVSENLDSYDAYLRDALLPWDSQLREIHKLVDSALSIEHD